MPVDQIGLYGLAAAVILALIGGLWLLVTAFKQSVWWGLGVLLFPPLALVFIGRHFKPSRGPLALLLLSGLLVAGALVAGQYIPRDPRVRIVEGEKHVTLTRAVVDDYSFLTRHPDVVVLQMANDDVTDETLRHLAGMSELRVLDLSDTKITDDGLAVLAGLPGLDSLYLARTAITDDGFRKHLFDRPGLLKLDVTGCKVRGKTKRDWLARNRDRKLVD